MAFNIVRMSLERIDIHVECLIFSADSPISARMIKSSIDSVFMYEFSLADIQESIERLRSKYNHESYSFQIEEINEAFVFMTKPAFHDTVGAYLKEKSNKKLTKVAMETLSIIAYKQPVSKTIIESIRGVNCDYTVQKLLEKELIEISGRGDGPGKPLLYRTSEKFMDYFGLKSIKDLPSMKDLQQDQESIGEPSEIEIVRPVNEEE